MQYGNSQWTRISSGIYRWYQIVAPRYSSFSVISCPMVHPTWWTSVNVETCAKKNGHGTKKEGKGEVCEWEKIACEVEGEEADHRQDDKTLDSLLWQSHQIRYHLAVFYYFQSTHSCPQHQYCPSGQRYWCKFNRALANSEPYKSHSPTIHPDIVPPLEKFFEQFAPPILMEHCILVATQNQNESIWQRCPKTEFCSATTVVTAVNLAVISFNSARSPSPNSRKGWRLLFLPSRGSAFLTRTSKGVFNSDEGRGAGEEEEADSTPG